jgi:integrase
MASKPRGRKKKYSEYEELVQSLPKVMTKRPKYVNGIGVFNGARGSTAWIKIGLPHGGVWKGKTYKSGQQLEIKVGSLDSWSWEQLEEQRKELQGRADRGEPLEDAPDWTFSSWAADWLERAKPRVQDYGSCEIHVRVHLNPTFGRMALNQIARVDINRWQSKQLQTHAPATVKRQLSTFKAIINDAVHSGLIERTPLVKLDEIKGIEGRQRFLTDEELVTLLAKAEDIAEWLPDFILWQVHSGMRKGETMQLEWSEVLELKDDRVLIQINKTKSGKGRTVVATKTMKAILQRQKDRSIDGDNSVFPVSKMTLRRRWEAARDVAGLSDVTIHDIRRTHATQAAVAGVGLRTLAGRLGHRDLSMLEKHYAALVDSAADEAAVKIEDVFPAPS